MLLLIFVVSLAVLAGIVRHDEELMRKSKQRSSSREALDCNPEPDGSDVKILAEALEWHSRGTRPEVLEPSHAEQKTAV